MQALIRRDFLELAGQLQKGLVVGPLAAQVDVLDLLQPLPQNPQALGELHVRPIKGKAIALALSFAFQGPLDQTVGAEQRKSLQSFARQAIGLHTLAEALDPAGLRIKGASESASVLA